MQKLTREIKKEIDKELEGVEAIKEINECRDKIREPEYFKNMTGSHITQWMNKLEGHRQDLMEHLGLLADLENDVVQGVTGLEDDEKIANKKKKMMSIMSNPSSLTITEVRAEIKKPLLDNIILRIKTEHIKKQIEFYSKRAWKLIEILEHRLNELSRMNKQKGEQVRIIKSEDVKHKPIKGGQ